MRRPSSHDWMAVSFQVVKTVGTVRTVRTVACSDLLT
jgi:hypothetical protein